MKTRTLITAASLYAATQLFSACIPTTTATIEGLSREQKQQYTAQKAVAQNHTLFYQGSLKNPDAVIADENGGLELEIKRNSSFKKVSPENTQQILKQTYKMRPEKMQIKTTEQEASLGYIFTFAHGPDAEEKYDITPNTSSGYFSVMDKSRSTGSGGGAGGGSSGGSGGGI